MYFLGVDIGNTKSHALIADNQGQIVGFGVAGNGNHEVIGVDGFKSVLKNIVYQALDKAGISPTAITGAGFGIAGFDWESDRPLMNEAVDELGMDCPYICVNDAVIGLAAGARAGWGISVSSGTSCNCWGRSLDGREGHVSGNGGNFAEYGGGSEIVMYSIHAISRAWSLRGPQTQLTDFFCQHTGAKDAADLLEGLARGRFHLGSSNAPIFFKAFHAGDPVARAGIEWISAELANLAIGVIRQLQFENLAFEVVLAGSFYNGTPLIEQLMRPAIREIAPGASLVRLDAPPVVGGIVLGMQSANFPFQPLRETLIKNARSHVQGDA